MSSKSGNTTVSCRATLPVCYANLFQHISTSTRHGNDPTSGKLLHHTTIDNHGAATCHFPSPCAANLSESFQHSVLSQTWNMPASFWALAQCNMGFLTYSGHMTMIPKPEVSLISSYFPSLNGHRLYPVSRYPALEKPQKKMGELRTTIWLWLT